MIFADVIVDISVKSLDRPFQYIVPEEMKKLWDGWVLIDGKGRII